MCKLSEHWLVSKLLKVLQIYRLKPLIDSFQGCYRDKFRFFSGLYFIYRVLILASYSITRSISQFFIVSQFLLVTFMGLHSVVQPYRKQSHNIIDSLIFTNLIVINGCTIFLEVYNVESRENHFAGGQRIVSLFVAVQVILLYVPMVCFILWMGIRLVRFASQFCALKKQPNDLHSSNTIDEGILYTVDYHEMTAASSKKRPLLVSSTQESQDNQQPKVKISKATHL